MKFKRRDEIQSQKTPLMFKAHSKEIANLRDKIYRRLMQELQESTSWLSETAENGNREHGWEFFFLKK